MHSIISVKQISGSKAQLVFEKANRENQLETVLACEACIGKNGLGKAREGDSKTPIGEFGVLYAFGIKKNPGTKIDYLQITDSHYACDENCEYYNKIIDIKTVNHRCKGEHMIEFVPQYNYGIFLDYNKDCTYPDGSAIFLHCNGNKGYTAGCISVKEEDMVFILKNIEKNTIIRVEE